ncbi:Hsp33 family molecular chaperone HslO [Risungbinella massiliensis]|uniref:Hsp33 family molecular chaperone HslO n=1 Tax=Risungbinella massiliensis TaxID=1329796 RepID=UPI0005CC67E7|nr:Hsp33 family molecular chaperone HslO [Risungbinella massiliensis]
MVDYAVRAISKSGHIRGLAAITTDLVQDLQKAHTTLPVVSAALGRTATMGALIGLTLKDPRYRVTIRVDGDGPIGKIVVDANGTGQVRGYVDNPAVLIPLKENGKLDVSGAVGEGMIYINRDLGLREPYGGASPIISGELAEDFTYYFTTSEQTPSSVGLGVLVNRDKIMVAGGYMIQLMPQVEEEEIAQLEERIAKMNGGVTEHFHKGVTPEGLLRLLMGDDASILDKQDLQFHCTCSKEQIGGVLKSLGSKEVEAILTEDGKAEVVCHFCNTKYHYSGEDLKQLLSELN